MHGSFMKKEHGVRKALGAFLAAVLFVDAAAAAAADAPANVAGSWHISVTGDTGTAEQTIVFRMAIRSPELSKVHVNPVRWRLPWMGTTSNFM
jgi:hypothetical protein